MLDRGYGSPSDSAGLYSTQGQAAQETTVQLILGHYTRVVINSGDSAGGCWTCASSSRRAILVVAQPEAEAERWTTIMRYDKAENRATSTPVL